MPSHKTEVHHLMVWMPNWIGDVVFALPSIQALRQHYPRARITAVARPPSTQILSHHPVIDSVITAPHGSGQGTVSDFKFALGLRKYHFDLALLFPNSFRSAWMAAMGGIRRRIGYKTDGRGFLLTDGVSVSASSRTVHGEKYYEGILSPLNLKLPADWKPAQVTPEEKEAQAGLMGRLGILETDFKIALAPGASKPEKRWHADRFGILCQKLVKERNAKIILLGSPGERELLRQIARFCPPESTCVLAGLHLQIVAGVLSNCRFLIGNDSGIMNLAALVGTPLVAIFGPGSPSTTDPMIEESKKETVTLNFPCSPCRHDFFRECQPSPHNKPFCLEDISVSTVAEAVDRLIQKLG